MYQLQIFTIDISLTVARRNVSQCSRALGHVCLAIGNSFFLLHFVCKSYALGQYTAKDTCTIYLTRNV